VEAAHRIRFIEKDPRRAAISHAIYPYDWEYAENLGKAGKVFFRPAKSDDERAVKEFFYSLPNDDIYIRFLSHMKAYPYYDVKSMVNIDYQNDICILGFAGGDAGPQRIVSVAFYHLEDRSMVADLDFVVHPDYARCGIATSMARRIAEKCRQRNVKALVSYLSPGNERVFGVFQKLGYVVEITMPSGIYEIVVRLDLPRTRRHG